MWTSLCNIFKTDEIVEEIDEGIMVARRPHWFYRIIEFLGCPVFRVMFFTIVIPFALLWLILVGVVYVVAHGIGFRKGLR